MKRKPVSRRAVAALGSSRGRRRGPGRPFPKGTSGCPTGRPKGALDARTIGVRQQLEGAAGEAADALLALLRQKKAPHVRLAAARDILDRTLGRAASKVELTGALDLSGLRARLGAMAPAAVERLAALLGRASLSAAEEKELATLRVTAGLEDDV